MGIATVPVAPVGVSPTGPEHELRIKRGIRSAGEIFGGTPKIAGETPRAPK
jgi:hypothetical protein